MEIGVRISEERERLGMNQADFARLAGMSDRAQRLYEKGERFPDAQYLAAVAGHGVDVLYVLTGQYAGGVKPAPALTAEEATLLEYFRAAPPAVRRAAMGALLGAASARGMTQIQSAGGIQISGSGNRVSKKRS